MPSSRKEGFSQQIVGISAGLCQRSIQQVCDDSLPDDNLPMTMVIITAGMVLARIEL